MANIKSAAKRAKQAEVRRQHNIAIKSRMRSQLKKVLSAISAGDKEAANTELKNATILLDRNANNNIIHANKAARHKSRLNAKIAAL